MCVWGALGFTPLTQELSWYNIQKAPAIFLSLPPPTSPPQDLQVCAQPCPNSFHGLGGLELRYRELLTAESSPLPRSGGGVLEGVTVFVGEFETVGIKRASGV